MPTESPRITVGVACYNASATIGRAIESALSQVWANLDILIVDDCSTDDSWSVIGAYVQKDSRIRAIQNDHNVGVGGTRATIVREAKGDFVAFFDDDDEGDSNRVGTQLRRITDYEKQAGTDLVACFASGTRIYPNGYRMQVDAIGSRAIVPRGEEVADYLLFNERKKGRFYGAGTPTCALMLRKEVVLRAGGFDPDFRRVEDVDFAVRLARIGGHFIGCAENLYVQYATSGSDKSAKANYTAEQRLFEKHKDYLLRKRRYHYARNWFRFRYYHFSRLPLRAVGALAMCLVVHPWLVSRHLFRSAPRRFLHEIKMRREQAGK